MKRRSFLQATMAAIIGLPALFNDKKPHTEKRCWELEVPIEHCTPLYVISSDPNCWEVTLGWDSSGHVMSVYTERNPSIHPDITEQRSDDTSLWRRS